MNTMIFTIAMTILLQPTLKYEFPCPRHSMKCYPEVVMPGESLYILVEVENPYDKPIYIDDIYRPNDGDIKIRIQDSKKESQPLLFEVFVYRLANYPLYLAEVNPGETRVIGALSINIPSLEDLHEPFWENHLKGISSEGKDFLLQVSVISRPWASNFKLLKDNEFVDFLTQKTNAEHLLHGLEITLGQRILMKSRPVREMAMIERWYDNTPKEFFPEPIGGVTSLGNNPQLSSNVFWSKVIRVQNENYSQWLFVRRGNRYPGDPNAPTTWQGWKELEESITPSTMRDEIRLTRMVIQFCDTRDAKVLDELKNWFDGMNEVQRTVMAKSIRDRAEHTYGEKLLPQFGEIYQTIREFDVVPIPESNEKHLRNLGLLE